LSKVAVRLELQNSGRLLFWLPNKVLGGW